MDLVCINMQIGDKKWEQNGISIEYLIRNKWSIKIDHLFPGESFEFPIWYLNWSASASVLHQINWVQFMINSQNSRKLITIHRIQQIYLFHANIHWKSNTHFLFCSSNSDDDADDVAFYSDVFHRNSFFSSLTFSHRPQKSIEEGSNIYISSRGWYRGRYYDNANH